jgi:hypothetical protein
MSLLNKNFGLDQTVKIRAHKSLSMVGRTGKVIGKHSEYTGIHGQIDSYIILLDEPLDWPSILVTEPNLEKVNNK